MAAKNVNITELDFLSIRNNLKDFLRSQTTFQDFDFEGSGMSVLLDLLSVNTHYLGFYLNMTANEMFADSAQLRKSIISHAKLQNYVPGSNEGALVKANIDVTPSNSEDQATNTITLDKYSRFLGTDIDGVNHQFVALNSNTTSKVANTFSFANVYLKQGEVVTKQYLMNASTNPKRRFNIPSTTVDTTSIAVSVQASASNTSTTTYTLAEDITELTPYTPVYFLEENDEGVYDLYFGDNTLGKQPPDSSIIVCTYLNTIGAASNNISRFVAIDSIAGLYSDNVRITANGSSYGGSDRETVEQVRFRAPYFYTTQNRAVTRNDYETLLLKDYNYIKSVSVWGGEDNIPVIYGKVYISVQTKGNYPLTNFEKETIKDALIESRSVVTVTPEIVDPNYVYLLFSGSVRYDPKLTTKTSGEILALVKAAVQDYEDDELTGFNSTFRKSHLQQYIEDADKSITGSDIDVMVQRRILLDITRQRSYIADFGLPLQRTTGPGRLSTFPQVQMNDLSGVAHMAQFEEIPDADTGIYSIEIVNAGSGYTSVPTVTILGDGTAATATAEIQSGKVQKITVTTKGTNYSTAIVTITGGDGSGATAIATYEARRGKLRAFYYKENREKVVLVEDAGSINYDTGEVTLTALRAYQVTSTPHLNTNYLVVDVMAENEIISPLRNRIVTIDANYPKTFQINMVSET